MINQKDICLTCLSDLAFDNDLFIDMGDYNNDSVLFVITDENSKINGNDYGIQIIQDREIVVTYLGKEYVTFLPENVKVNPVKNIAKGQNKINKIDGIVYLNYDFECSDEADNDGDSAVDMDDTGCLTLTDNNEIN